MILSYFIIESYKIFVYAHFISKCDYKACKRLFPNTPLSRPQYSKLILILLEIKSGFTRLVTHRVSTWISRLRGD